MEGRGCLVANKELHGQLLEVNNLRAVFVDVQRTFFAGQTIADDILGLDGKRGENTKRQ